MPNSYELKTIITFIKTVSITRSKTFLFALDHIFIQVKALSVLTIIVIEEVPHVQRHITENINMDPFTGAT